MDREEEIILATINIDNVKKNNKKKYFRIEKIKKSFSKENKKKSIFKTKKDYNLLNKKMLRNKEKQKQIISIYNKFITKNVEDTTASAQSDNSILVQNIISKKLIIKENKKQSKNTINSSKLEQNSLIMDNSLFYAENNEKNSNNLDLNKIKIKLMFVYFCSIKNLCKYINKNLFNIQVNESEIIDEFLYQIYQDLQILNRKIKEFKLFENIKDNVKLKKDDFYDIDNLKDNLLLMKNVLNNALSQNLNNIYISIENFCKVYSS